MQKKKVLIFLFLIIFLIGLSAAFLKLNRLNNSPKRMKNYRVIDILGIKSNIYLSNYKNLMYYTEQTDLNKKLLEEGLDYQKKCPNNAINLVNYEKLKENPKLDQTKYPVDAKKLRLELECHQRINVFLRRIPLKFVHRYRNNLRKN